VNGERASDHVGETDTGGTTGSPRFRLSDAWASHSGSGSSTTGGTTVSAINDSAGLSLLQIPSAPLQGPPA